MGFFWPTKLKAEPGALARFGRVLHRFFAACALALVVGGLVWLTKQPDIGYLAVVQFNGGFAGAFFMFGRAVRYVLSGE